MVRYGYIKPLMLTCSLCNKENVVKAHKGHKHCYKCDLKTRVGGAMKEDIRRVNKKAGQKRRAINFNAKHVKHGSIYYKRCEMGYMDCEIRGYCNGDC